MRDPQNLRIVVESPAGVIDILTEALLVLLSSPSQNRKILDVVKFTCQILGDIAAQNEGAFLVWQIAENHQKRAQKHPLVFVIDTFSAPKNESEQKICKFVLDTRNSIQRMQNDMNQGRFRPSKQLEQMSHALTNRQIMPPGPQPIPQVIQNTYLFQVENVYKLVRHFKNWLDGD